MTTTKKTVFRLRFTLYGWNIYKGGRKVEGPIEEEWRAKARMEILEERQTK